LASDEKPPNVQLRKGRWFWEPPAKQKCLKGVKARPLGADQVLAWSHARRLNAELEGMPIGAHMAGTVGWLFEQFFESENFTSKAKSTQMDYRWLATRLGRVKLVEKDLAAIPAASIKPRHADMIIASVEKISGHSTAHYCARFARRVWKWAARLEYVGQVVNPWKDMELKGLPERTQIWTPEQVAAVIAKSQEPGQKPSLGIAAHIAYAFGHRKGDVLTLTWSDWDTGFRKTQKTGVTLPIVPSSYPDMESAVEAERVRNAARKSPSIYIVVNESTGRPWQAEVFSHQFRALADAAGIPKELQFRDLRATAATEMKDAGADILDMSTHTGHKTTTMARRYARPTAAQFQRAAAKRQANKPAGNDPGPGDKKKDASS
jgi:integrase